MSLVDTAPSDGAWALYFRGLKAGDSRPVINHGSQMPLRFVTVGAKPENRGSKHCCNNIQAMMAMPLHT